MVIKKAETYTARSAAKQWEMDLRNAEQVRPASTRSKSPADDLSRVEYSRQYHEMDHLKKVIMEIPNIRVECVDHYRNMIANDAYTVDPSRFCGKILDEQW